MVEKLNLDGLVTIKFEQGVDGSWFISGKKLSPTSEHCYSKHIGLNLLSDLIDNKLGFGKKSTPIAHTVGIVKVTDTVRGK